MINIQNIDNNECFKWCLVRYLHSADCNPPIITKADKDFTEKLDCKDVKFPLKTRDINKTEEKKKNSIGIGAFGYKNKKKYSIHVSKKWFEEKHVDLLLFT